jgi:hypothetical protein
MKRFNVLKISFTGLESFNILSATIAKRDVKVFKICCYPPHLTAVRLTACPPHLIL